MLDKMLDTICVEFKLPRVFITICSPELHYAKLYIVLRSLQVRPNANPASFYLVSHLKHTSEGESVYFNG